VRSSQPATAVQLIPTSFARPRPASGCGKRGKKFNTRGNDKIIGFLCAADGQSSYMSVMAYGNNLMPDFCCTIVSRLVYLTAEVFDDDNGHEPENREPNSGTLCGIRTLLARASKLD
jgi:hypothetical protein